MSEHSHRDRVVEEVVDKVAQKPSIRADREAVRARATRAVDELMDAPVRTFAPLLAENAVISELHRERKGGRSES